MNLIAIDPGSASGAYALFLRGQVPCVGDLPVVDGQIDAAAFARFLGGAEVSMAVVERVGAMPKQGVASTFKFGVAVGIIRGVLQTLAVQTLYVTPGVWKKFHGLDADKETARRIAIEKYPGVPGLDRKKDHGRAEALLIGAWLLGTKGAS